MTLALCALTLPGWSALGAQFLQYAEPGSLAREQVSLAEQAEKRAEEARWTLGKWRIAPDVALRDVAWTDNVYDSRDETEGVSDFTATVRAGLEGLIHLGPDVLFSLRGTPSYTWWQDQEDLRSSQVSFGAGLFGLHNRVQWEIVANHEEVQSFANDELRVPLDLESDHASVGLRVELGSAFALFGRAEEVEAEYPDSTPEGGPTVDLTSLDRSESVVAGGLFYQPGETLRIGLGVERSDVEFDTDPGGRSNTASGPLVSVSVPGNRVNVDLNAVLRDIEFDNPELGDTEELTGRGRVAWQLGTRTFATLYGARNVVYSALDSSSFFTSGVAGVQLGWSSEPDQRGIRVSLIGESAANRYEGDPGGLAGREDDITNYGLTFAFPYRDLLTLELGVIQSDIDSSLPEFDRSYTRIHTGIRLEPLGPGR